MDIGVWRRLITNGVSITDAFDVMVNFCIFTKGLVVYNFLVALSYDGLLLSFLIYDINIRFTTTFQKKVSISSTRVGVVG